MWPLVDPWLEAQRAWECAWVPWCGASAMADWRAPRLLTLLEHAAKHSPIHAERGLSADGRIRPFAQWRPTRKAELMSDFYRWVTDPALELDGIRAFMRDKTRIGDAYMGRYMVWESSGSSGEPGVFVQDAQAMAVYDALESLRRPWVAVPPWLDPFGSGQRFAFVGAIDGHFATAVSSQRLRRIVPGLESRLQCFSFMQPLEELCDQLDRFAPSVLATYPTTAVALAEQASRGRLKLSLRRVMTGGEQLTAPMRRYIAHAMGCPVFDSYGASEHLAIASECRHGRLHVNSDWVVLESVDEHDRPVPDGVTGSHTLLTNLANHVQPLIRYVMDDRIRWLADRCTCGSPLPAIELHGRSDDMLSMLDAEGAPVRLAPLALVTVLEEEADLFDFQVVQDGARSMVLHVGPHEDKARAEAGRRALAAYLGQQHLGKVSLRVSRGAFAHGRSGKCKRIVGLGVNAQAAARSAADAS